MHARALMILILLATSSAAWAAPTCQDRQGATVRCGTANAMPVGWKAPTYDRATPPAGNRRDMVIAAGAIILLLALIALLPEFEQDWDNEQKKK